MTAGVRVAGESGGPTTWAVIGVGALLALLLILIIRARTDREPDGAAV